jgi:hypothetical protein
MLCPYAVFGAPMAASPALNTGSDMRQTCNANASPIGAMAIARKQRIDVSAIAEGSGRGAGR